MKKLLVLVLLILPFCIANARADENSANVLTVFFYNDSNTNLTYTGSSVMNPVHTIKVIPATVRPQHLAVITIRASNDFDLCGALHFIDDNKQTEDLFVMDFRKFHPGQFILSLKNALYSSDLKYTHRQTSSDPLSLIVDVAKIRVKSQNEI